MRKIASVAVLLQFAVLAALAVSPAAPRASCEPAGSFRFFRDENEAPWAVTYLGKASLKGFLTGYPDGRFLPNSGVTRAEVIVALLRLIPDAAREADPSAISLLPDSGAIERDFPWAAGPIGKALALGIIDVDSEPFDPAAPATRVWIAETTVRALGLDEEAQAQSGQALPFADCSGLSDSEAGYISVVNSMGIMTGDAGAFHPGRNITRAEYAAVLDRCSDVIGPAGGVELRGRLAAVDAKKSVVSMRVFRSDWWKRVREIGYWDQGDVHSGDTVTLQVSADAMVLLDGKMVGLKSLKRDHLASIVWDSRGFAILIDARSKSAAHWPSLGKTQAEGTVIEVKRPAGPVLVLRTLSGEIAAFGVNSGCKVTRNGKAAELADVEPGDSAVVKVTDSMITSIVAEEPPRAVEFEGTIKTLSLGPEAELYIADDRGVRRKIDIGTECVVTRGGRRSSLVELKYGDHARVRVTEGEATEIAVILPEGVFEIEGIVKELSFGSDSRVRVRDSSGNDETYRFSPYCIARQGNRAASMEDIRIGDRVLLEMETKAGSPEAVVNVITVRQTSEQSGWVDTIEPESAPPRLKVRLFSGNSLTAWISTDAPVWRKGKAVDIEDVKSGDRVKMSLVDGVVTRLQVEDSLSAVDGVVEKVDPRRRRITVRPQEEDSLTLEVGSDAKITYLKEPIAVDEILIGDRVVIKIKGGLASAVEVEDRVPRDVSGRVTRVTMGTSPKIWVKTEDDSTVSYAIATDVNIVYDGFPLEAADILKDDQVELRVYGSRVTRIKITRRVSAETQGVVVAVLCDLTEGYAIRIRDADGDVVSYKVMDGAPVRKGSETLDFGDIEEGAVVNLRLDGNVVTRITIL